MLLTTLDCLEPFQKLCYVDDFRIAVFLQYKEVFVAGDKQIGSGGFRQSKEIVITGVSAD